MTARMLASRQRLQSRRYLAGPTRLLALYSIFSALTTHALAANVTLAVFIPLTGDKSFGRKMGSAFLLAIEDVNSNPNLLPNHMLTYFYNDTGCNARKGLGEVVDMWVNQAGNVHGMIGPACDLVCEPSGMLAANWQIPLISWGCSSSHLSNKDDFPTLARTLGPYTKMAKMFVKMLEYWKWSRVSILASTENVWQLTSHQIKLELEEAGKNVAYFHSFDPGHQNINGREKAQHWDILKDAASKARIIFICAKGGDVREIMLYALDQKLITGDYVFITIDVLEAAHYGRNTWMGEDGRDAEAEYAFSGLLNVHLLTPTSTKYKNFEARVRQRMAGEPLYLPLKADDKVDVHAGMMYDAVLLYANALNDTISNNKGDHTNGGVVASYMFNRSFEGIAGNVFIDQYGDRESDFSVQNYHDEHFFDFAQYFFHNDSFSIQENVLIVWPGGSTGPPRDHPDCGWDNEFCVVDTSSALVATLSTISVIFVAAVVFGLLFYRKMKRDADRRSTDQWQVQYEDIIFSAKSTGGSGSSISKTKSGHLSLNSNSLSKSNGSPTHTVISSSGQVFTRVGNYKGIDVAIKSVKKNRVDLSKDIQAELLMMREAAHENINTFMGACFNAPHVCLLYSYCSKGSLQDVLENEDYRLNDDFKMAIAADIAKGVSFLHRTQFQSHGRLKSSNCVIDNRWVCKITDYGMGLFKQGQEERSMDDEFAIYTDKLWTAPELLRSTQPSLYGSQKGDVYSYGIILSEIITRAGPYAAETKLEPKEIVILLKKAKSPLCRPNIPRDSCSAKMYEMMTSCWEEEPNNRPTFKEIEHLIKKMNKGKTTNIVDNMINMMEQYANNLEQLVGERTEQLEEEKKKTDQLLHQLLPKTVAEKLKLGSIVHPEMYDSATIFFSDIVAFTQLSSSSTPMQVVDFLNDLYTLFDGRIDNYDVYKVETIGDAYMVASGLPIKNGFKHAGEIATLALDLLSGVVNFRIRHRPDMQLQLRIGIHSGPVVAGVVGLKMPRYCLFGDTVNTASRMESSGLALRIQVSATTCMILQTLGGYIMTKRGEISVKGKGEITTYWLTGKLDFDKTLPDLEQALPATEHEFK